MYNLNYQHDVGNNLTYRLVNLQVLLNQNIPSRGINIKSSDEPIYVPGAYMVNFNLLLVP